MSAPDIQLYPSAQTKYFEPDVRTYIQKVEQAVVSNNFPAARQAFEQLDKSVRESKARGGKAEIRRSPEVTQSLGDVSEALKEGDAHAATSALARLRGNFSIPPKQAVSADPAIQDARDEEGPPKQQVSVRI